MSALSVGAKDDERALWAAVLAGQWPRAAAVRLGIPPARVEYLCSKWSRRGIYEWGVTHDLGWATTRDAEAKPPRTLAEAGLGLAHEEIGAEVYLSVGVPLRWEPQADHPDRFTIVLDNSEGRFTPSIPLRLIYPRRITFRLVPREKSEASRMHQEYHRRQMARRRRRRQR